MLRVVSFHSDVLRISVLILKKPLSVWTLSDLDFESVLFIVWMPIIQSEKLR